MKQVRTMVEFEMNFHLGDCLTQMHWMKRSCAIQQDTDFIFYCQTQYHAECNEFAGNYRKRISVRPHGEKTAQAVDCWICPILTAVIKKHPKTAGVKTLGRLRNYDLDYSEVFLLLYQALADRTGLENPIKTKEDVMLDIPEGKIRADAPAGPYKYLVINAPSLSNEFDYNPEDWEWLLRQCAARGPTICTHPNHAGVFSTLEHGWSLCDLGRVSHLAENVISVHTAPIWVAINHRSIKAVKFWLVCTHGHWFGYNERFHWARNFEAAKLLLERRGLIG